MMAQELHRTYIQVESVPIGLNIFIANALVNLAIHVINKLVGLLKDQN
jgi:hypothetical protein